jgi:small GTP-binding protein
VIQKKVCMLGAFATGKSSLVRQFVHSVFSERYHTTVGVKIDRKAVRHGDLDVNMLLWDLAGEDDFQSVQPMYLRGASGLVFVVDGTRSATLEKARSLFELAETVVGPVPSVVALNKSDLTTDWELSGSETAELTSVERKVLRTSAKTGAGVGDMFHWLAEAMAHTDE